MADALASDSGTDDWGSGDAPAPTGDAYLSVLDPARAAMVKAIGDGKLKLPPTTTRGGVISPQTQALIADVAQYNPGFDDVDAPSRIAARKAFTSGKQGQNITSFNTALDHLNYLDQAVTGLGNVSSWIPGTTHLLNSARNSFKDADGNTQVSQFEASVPNVLDELVKAVRGTGGNEADINRLEKAFNLSQSPEQQRAVIQSWAQQLNGRIGEMRNSYHTAIGTTAEDLPGISPDAQSHLQAFLSPDYVGKGIVAGPAAGGGAGGGSPPVPPVPGAPQGGPHGGPPAPLDPTGQGDIGFNQPGGPPPSPLTTEQQGAYDAFLKANPKATADQLRGFAQSLGLGLANADQIVSQRDAGIGVAPGSSAIYEAKPVAEDATGSAVINAANGVTFGALPKIGAGLSALTSKIEGDPRNLGDLYGQQLASNNATFDQASDQHPLAALGGGIAGFLAGDGVIGAAPGVAALAGRIPTALRPLAGDALYGAAYGAGSSDNLADIPGSALRGAGEAALGGALGRGLVRSGAAILSPVANDAVRRLTNAGVTLTPGQILGANGGIVGSTVKGIEDRAAGFPIVGDIINNARRGGVDDFNKATINDALAPIGETASDVGHAGIADAQQKVSAAYTSALGRMSAVPDATFTSDIQAATKKASGLSDTHEKAFSSAIETHVDPYIAGKNALDGQDLQSIKQGLDKEIADYNGSGSTPQDRKLADILSDVRDSLLNLAGRTDPDSASDFQKANQAYAMLSRVNNAASKSKDGVFTPNQFRQAVTKRGYGTTTNNLARGSAPMQQLATDASTVLPSTVPDSGTAGRAALGLLAGKLAGAGSGAALGGGVGYENGGVTGALTGAALGAAAFSRTGLRATQKVLAGSRGRTFNTLGDILRANASLGGAAGVPLLLNDRSK